MNILMLTPYPPVLDMHGGGVRMFHNIRILSRRHRVRVISFILKEEERELLEPVRQICESVTAIRKDPDYRRHWLSLQPFLHREFSAPEMYRAVDDAFRSQPVDVLQCEYLHMAQFRRPGTFSILTAHETMSKNSRDAISSQSSPLLQVGLFYNWMQLLRYEVLETRKFDRVVTMTTEDAAYLRSYSRNLNVRSIPIGVDLERFSPLPENPAQPLEVLFVGNYRHTPNVEALLFLVRHVVPHFPGIRFLFPGSYAPPVVDAGTNVFFPGFVLEIQNVYRRPNTIVMAPLFSGTGQRVKLLEAFAMACPVITTPIGAKGFPIRHGEEALIADSADEFIKALSDLSTSLERRRHIGESGRRMVSDHFGWDRIAEELLGIVEEAAVSN
jgi:glycosyltransferase involved in cell wall biosynthesis